LNKYGWQIDFLPFCINNSLNDANAAAELINGSATSTHKTIWHKPDTFQEAINILSSYEKVISQRFHGTILANIAEVPVLTLHHHDKLRSGENTLSYYNFSKAAFLESLKNLKDGKEQDKNKFNELQLKVRHALCRN
jgi:exopolysaccharide biosynthesis predicted pyruvyltransferase EpsI